MGTTRVERGSLRLGSWRGCRGPRDDLALADGAPRNARRQIARLERLRLWLGELSILLHRREPVRNGSGVVVATAVALAFNERRRSEVFQTGAGRHQGLAASFRTGIRVLQTSLRVNKFIQIDLTSFSFTIRKLKPIHRSCQPAGQAGISMLWLWTAMTLVLVSQTEHLET